MHFWVSVARVSLPGRAPAQWETSGARSPRKIGTNWFIPAFVKSRPGESGRSDAEGTTVWPRSAKKSRKDWRISEDFIARLMIASAMARVPTDAPAEGDVGRAGAPGDRLLHGRLDPGGDGSQAEAVAQHERRR